MIARQAKTMPQALLTERLNVNQVHLTAFRTEARR